jgi:drug/metabolite transporter (DMT)-like permease
MRMFWGTTWIASKKESGICLHYNSPVRQFIGGYFTFPFSCIKRGLAKGKTVENNHHLSILNFALSNGLSTWGVKFISSGLGAILNAVFPLWIVIITFQGRKISKVSNSGTHNKL